jgi:hypothetical protein
MNQGGHGPKASLRGGTSLGAWVSLHYVRLIEATFLALVLVNLLDLWTSVVALNIGLAEGNGLVLALSNSLGIQVAGGLALIKVVEVFACLAAAIVGLRSQSLRVKETALIIMVFLTAFLLVVSVGNLYLILMSY